MQQPESKSAITRDKYDAVLLDLDGVITGQHTRDVLETDV